MTSIEDMVGKLLRVPFVYPAYTESDPLGTPSIRLDKDDQIVLISYAVRSNESLWMPTWQPTKNRTQYLTLKVLTGKGYIALMTVSKAALIDFWKVSV